VSAASDLLGYDWLAQPYTSGEAVAGTYLRIAKWVINTVSLGPPWREGHPWVVQLREATMRVLVAQVSIPWDGHAAMGFYPELAPAPAPYMVELLPQDGYGEISLFLPLVRCGATRKPIVFRDATDRLQVVML